MLDRPIDLPVELALTPDQEPAAPAKTTSPTIAANARGRGIRPRLNVRLTWIPQLLGRMNHAGCSVGGRADRLDPGTMLTRKTQHRTLAMLMRSGQQARQLETPRAVFDFVS